MHLSHTVDSNGVEILDCTAVVGSFTAGGSKVFGTAPPFCR
jgi:hypothetical protein